MKYHMKNETSNSVNPKNSVKMCHLVTHTVISVTRAFFFENLDFLVKMWKKRAKIV